ncbi:sensor histidine kinase [Nocardia asteroides]
MVAVLRLLAIPIGVVYVALRGANDIDIVIAILSGGALVAGARWPLAVVCGQAVLLVGAHEYGLSAGVGVKAWAAVALFELALRRGPRQQAAGVVALCAAYVAIDGASEPGSVPLAYRLLLLVVVPVLGGGYIASLRRRAEEAERNVALQAEAARRSERTRIARDLHDIVAHHVSAILVRVGMARYVPVLAAEEVETLLADIHSTAEAAMNDLHELMNVLREDIRAAGVGSLLADDRSALPGLIDTLLTNASRAGLLVESTIDPAVADIDGVRGLVLYRTMQEGITNAIKHAEAGTALTVRAAMMTTAASLY